MIWHTSAAPLCPAHSWATLPLYDLASERVPLQSMCLYARDRSSLRSTWLSDVRPLRSPALSPHLPHTLQPLPFCPFAVAPPHPYPTPPPPLLSSASNFHSSHKEGERTFCFLRPTCPPRYGLHPSTSSSQAKSLFRLRSAENHMECDITRAGSWERGMAERGERLACQVSLR